jgi:hypothetical protein
MTRHKLYLQRLAAAAACCACLTPAAHAQGAASPREAMFQAYQELFTLSQKEKRGLMFYVRGQQIGGAVTRVIGRDAVEVRNQTYNRIIIRIDEIDALAIN